MPRLFLLGSRDEQKNELNRHCPSPSPIGLTWAVVLGILLLENGGWAHEVSTGSGWTKIVHIKLCETRMDGQGGWGSIARLCKKKKGGGWEKKYKRVTSQGGFRNHLTKPREKGEEKKEERERDVV